MFKPRPCLVCETPCVSEGQLCAACVERGHWVKDDQVFVNIEVRIPDALVR